MKGTLTRADGRLRTGLISLGIFLLLLIIPGIAMQLNDSAEQVMVKVKHQFEAQPKPVVHEPVTEPVKQTEKSAEVIASQTELNPQSMQVDAAQEQEPPAAAQSSQSPSAQVASTVPEEHINAPAQPQAEEPPLKAAAQIVEVTLPESQPVAVHSVAQPKPAMQTSSLPVTEPPTQALTVNKEEYQKLFHAWRTSGAEKIEGGKPALLVENLRQAFDSFNMKPVVLSRGKGFDLLDGSQLPAGLLDNYAAIVFQVENPWQDWGTELKKLGLSRGNNIEVRYYMYDFIHNAIYARTHQALAWARQQGLVAADTLQGLEVRGRAYQIKQQGGGRFGVFVPQQILTASGQTIAVDLAALANQTDIQMLQQAGLL